MYVPNILFNQLQVHFCLIEYSSHQDISWIGLRVKTYMECKHEYFLFQLRRTSDGRYIPLLFFFIHLLQGSTTHTTWGERYSISFTHARSRAFPTKLLGRFSLPLLVGWKDMAFVARSRTVAIPLVCLQPPPISTALHTSKLTCTKARREVSM